MAELKTQKNKGSVRSFLAGIEHPKRKEDTKRVVEIMKEITGDKPAMWGDSIIGFGDYHYKYASGREANWFKAGVSPRKQSLTLYIMAGFDHYEDLMSRLGKHKTGKGCLYINKLEDVDEEVLRELIRSSYDFLTEYEKKQEGQG